MGTDHTCGPSPGKVSQQENPKYFSHKIKFQDTQARNRCAFLIAGAAPPSFSTTENCLENHLHKVCKCCQSDRREQGKAPGATSFPVRSSPALGSARLPPGAARGPGGRPRAGPSQASTPVGGQRVAPPGPRPRLCELR